MFSRLSLLNSNALEVAATDPLCLVNPLYSFCGGVVNVFLSSIVYVSFLVCETTVPYY
jgi:hypothetical protein